MPRTSTTQQVHDRCSVDLRCKMGWSMEVGLTCKSFASMMRRLLGVQGWSLMIWGRGKTQWNEAMHMTCCLCTLARGKM
jgi:hypothetical protein